jgi:hypothetical protein
LFGLHANRKWHYTRDQQPNRHVRWFIRSVGAPQTETILNLYASFKAWLTCSLPPWTIEAREAEAEEAAAFESDAAAAEGSIGGHVSASTTSSVRSARALARYKRIMTATGFVGTYICWAVFSWCVQNAERIVTSALPTHSLTRAAHALAGSFSYTARAEQRVVSPGVHRV